MTKIEKPQVDNTLATALLGLKCEIDAIKRESPPPILVAASKTQPASRLEAAIALGITHFGENRVQEAMGKWPSIAAAHPEVVVHLIGPLQSNKVKEAVALFGVIETLDRAKIADAIAKEGMRQGRRPEVFIQVNTGGEPQKSGVAPAALAALVRHCKDMAKLNLTGLMCVPPAGENPAPHFALMQKLAGEHGLSNLSMGMSGDFAVALRFGATHIRIGTRLFGPRE